MYGSTGNNHDYLNRVGSHATKGSRRGIVRIAPLTREEIEALTEPKLPVLRRYGTSVEIDRDFLQACADDLRKSDIAVIEAKATGADISDYKHERALAKAAAIRVDFEAREQARAARERAEEVQNNRKARNARKVQARKARKLLKALEAEEARKEAAKARREAETEAARKAVTTRWQERRERRRLRVEILDEIAAQKGVQLPPPKPAPEPPKDMFTKARELKARLAEAKAKRTAAQKDQRQRVTDILVGVLAA